MKRRRFQFVWWWDPADWGVRHLGPYPSSGSHSKGCIFTDRWQFGPLEIRKWNQTNAPRHMMSHRPMIFHPVKDAGLVLVVIVLTAIAVFLIAFHDVSCEQHGGAIKMLGVVLPICA
jgi:hypothetical protein